MDSNVKVAGYGPGETVAPGAALRGLRRRAGSEAEEEGARGTRKEGEEGRDEGRARKA
ncbi:MAG: hypothetical protein R6X12_08360 [bacterium]